MGSVYSRQDIKEHITSNCCICMKPAVRKCAGKKPLKGDTFYPAAFLPNFIRSAIKTGLEKQIPTSVLMSAVVLNIEVPVSRDLTDIYLDNIRVQGNIVHEVKMFFSSIIKLLQNRGGDIFCFIDSTVKCFWHVEAEHFPEAVVHVLDLALHIEETFCPKHSAGAWRLKTISAITAGEIKILMVGNPNERILWCVTGDVIQKGHIGRSFGQPGDVIIVNDSWNYVANHYTQSSYTAVKVQKDFLKVTRKLDKKKESTRASPRVKAKEIAEDAYKMTNILSPSEARQELEDLHDTFQASVEKWTPPLVATAVTIQQLEILSFMTSAVCCVYYLRNINLDALETLNLVVLKVLKITSRYEGMLSKLDYDRGLIFCVTFGTTGFKHNDDSLRSLKWGRDVIAEMKEIGYEGVVRIFSGMCYSSIIGPQYRMECSLIGKPVFSKLALIHKFTDIPIVCGSNTARRCRREFGNIFTLISERARGLKNIPLCFAVTFTESQEDPSAICVGRYQEKGAVLGILSELKDPQIDLGDRLPLIIIKGEVGMGKTTFMKCIIKQASKVGIKLTCVVGTFPYEETFEKAWHIVKKLLAFNYVNDETGIVELLAPETKKYPLHLLNKHFDTKFPKQNVNVHGEQIMLRKLLVTLLQACAKENVILITIDDGEHIAEQTALFLHDLLISRTAIVIMSLNESSSLECKHVKEMIDKNYASVSFHPLADNVIVDLACHFLNVVAIHNYLWSFLCKHSQGNPLRLQEILLLPQLQHHICFVEYRSIAPWKFEKSFVGPEDNLYIDVDNAKVCDISDLERLQFVFVPEQLLDIVKEHTSGLSPGEQMFIKKCAILGECFSLYILEAVCPEYTSSNLRDNVAKLVRKNMLALDCHHFEIYESGFRQSSVNELDDEYCYHAVKFSSQFLQQCVINFMQQRQKERIHSFIVSLLKDVKITCDSCRFCQEEQVLQPNECFSCEMKIPCLNLRSCHCLNFQVTVYRQIDYHLGKGNGLMERRVMFMLKAAEIALQAEKELQVGDFLEMAEKYANAPDNMFSSLELIKAKIHRLQAQKHYFLGGTKEAMESINQALQYLERNFPMDYLIKRVHTQYAQEKPEFVKEECRCLVVICKLLMQESRFKEAYNIAKTNQTLLDKYQLDNPESKFPSFTDLLTCECLLLVAGAKASAMKSKKRVAKYQNRILERCSNKLTKANKISTRPLESIIMAMAKVAFVLFERNELGIAEIIGFRAVQICKIVNGLEQLTHVTPVLCLIYCYSNAFGKCFEILNGLLDVITASGNIMGEAMYYSMLMKLLCIMDNAELASDNIRMCTAFAATKYDQPFPAGYLNHKYWITSMMCIWCAEFNLTEAYPAWYALAKQLKTQVKMTNCWTIISELRMAVIDVIKIKLISPPMRPDQAKVFMNCVRKNVNNIERCAKRYACVTMPMVKLAKRKIEETWREEKAPEK